MAENVVQCPNVSSLPELFEAPAPESTARRWSVPGVGRRTCFRVAHRRGNEPRLPA